MKKATAISAGLHAAVLLWAVLSWNGRTFEVTPAESLPVDFISEKDFSQMAKGQKDAPKAEKPKPLVEKKDAPKPVEDSKAKIAKKELKAARDDSPPPEPEPKPKPKPVEQKAVKDKPKPPPKIDEIGEKIKQQLEKKEKEAKLKPDRLPPRRPPRPKTTEKKFSFDEVRALLDKREATRTASAGDTLNNAPSLGYVHGAAATLSESEIDALKRRISQCWTVPVGAANAQNLSVVFRVGFRRDGTVAFGPELVAGTAGSSYGPAFAESGKRAILQCQPYTMLRPEHYEIWKDVEIEFKPSDIGGG